MSPLQLEGHIQEKESSEIDSLASRIERVERDLANVKRDVVRDSVIALLNIMHAAMREIASGKFDLDTAPLAVAGAPIAPQFDQKWEAWKQKLGAGEAPARVIDALLNHGPLNRTQLREAAGTAWSTLDAATARLKNLGLIEKIGDKWHLKG